MVDDQLSGRSLDALVAERVMEWTIIEATGENWFDAIPADRFPIFVRWPEGGTAVYESPFDIRSREFRPSESIEAAMQVVYMMREQGWSFACTLYDGKLPYASFCKGTAASSRNAEAESLSTAICLAALRAMEQKQS